MKTLGALCAILFGLTASAAQITGVSIQSSNGEAVGYGWDLAAVHLVDGSGLTGNVHGDCYANGTCWQNGFPGPVPAVLVFDLGAQYSVDSMHIWNGYWGNYQSARGANQVQISTSGDLAIWIPRGSFTFQQAPTESVSYTGFDIAELIWPGTRYVKFQIDSNWGGGDCGGCVTMNEVQFFGTQGEVPEPATLGLVTAALTAGLVIRRRRGTC